MSLPFYTPLGCSLFRSEARVLLFWASSRPKTHTFTHLAECTEKYTTQEFAPKDSFLCKIKAISAKSEEEGKEKIQALCAKDRNREIEDAKAREIATKGDIATQKPQRYMTVSMPKKPRTSGDYLCRKFAALTKTPLYKESHTLAQKHVQVVGHLVFNTRNKVKREQNTMVKFIEDLNPAMPHQGAEKLCL